MSPTIWHQAFQIRGTMWCGPTWSLWCSFRSAIYVEASCCIWVMTLQCHCHFGRTNLSDTRDSCTWHSLAGYEDKLPHQEVIPLHNCVWWRTSYHRDLHTLYASYLCSSDTKRKSSYCFLIYQSTSMIHDHTAKVLLQKKIIQTIVTALSGWQRKAASSLQQMSHQEEINSTHCSRYDTGSDAMETIAS